MKYYQALPYGIFIPVINGILHKLGLLFCKAALTVGLTL